MAQVYMLKDVEKVGMAGQIVKVTDGYASNYLVPNKLAVIVSDENIQFYKEKVTKAAVAAQVLTSKVAMMAERVKGINLTVKERVHDDGKLYGSVSAEVIVDLLKEKDIVVNKKQIEFPKTIKALGEHKVVVRFSSKLKPELTLKVVSDNK